MKFFNEILKRYITLKIMIWLLKENRNREQIPDTLRYVNKQIVINIQMLGNFESNKLDKPKFESKFKDLLKHFSGKIYIQSWLIF